MTMRQLRKPFFVCAIILAVGLLTLLAGLSSPGEIQAQTVASPITRYQVLYNALRYRVYMFTVRSYNVGTRTWYVCGGWTTISSDPYYQADHQHQGVAYKWGGGDTLDDLGSYPCCERFGTRLDNGDLVGDTDDSNWDHCYPDPKPVCPDAAGVDCSGFVTRVWGRPASEKYGTSTLPNISTPINFTQGNHQEELPRKMRMGDVFNYVGNHVVLLRYFENYPDHSPHFYESNWDANAVVESEGWDVVWPVTNDNSGYRPYRYNEIADDANLPNIKANYNGWNSIITIKNNGSENAVVQVTFYDSNGNALATKTKTDLSGQGIWMLDASTVVNNFSGSAVVAADKDISVVVQNRTFYTAAAYDGISPSTAPAPDPGFGRTGTTLRALPVYKNYEDWDTSLYIQNAGTASANVYIYFYKQDGTWKDTDGPYSIQPGASIELNQAGDGELGSSFFGSARIYSSNRPVAVVVRAANTLDVWWERAYSAFDTNISVSWEDPLWVPLFYEGYNDIYSRIHVQNWGSGTDVQTWYQTQDCLHSYWEEHYISYRAIQTFDIPDAPLPSYGSAWVQPDVARPLLGLVETDRTDPSQSVAYESISDQGATTLTYAPIVYKAYELWDTGIQVQNAHRWLNAKVKLYFLDSGGNTITTDRKSVV